MTEIKPVSELPPRQYGAKGIDWAEVCDKVAAENGAWCEVGTFNPSVATHIRNGRWPAIDPSKFEITTQKSDVPGRSRLYMRLRAV